MKKFSRYIAEKVNEKQIMKDLDSGMSADAVISKYANKKTTNTDEIRKVIKQHAWNKRMKKEETELSEVSAKMARRAAAASQAKAYTAGSGYQNPEQEKDADRLDKKSQKAMAHVKKRQGEKGVKRVNRLTGKMLGMEEIELDEKSVSQAQQKLMGMALAYKRGEMDDASDEVKKLASSMSEKDLEDFAKTKHKGLPKKVDEKLDPVGQSDSDIDNDGDVDSSDKYLHKRRKAIAKAIAKKTK